MHPRPSIWSLVLPLGIINTLIACGGSDDSAARSLEGDAGPVDAAPVEMADAAGLADGTVGIGDDAATMPDGTLADDGGSVSVDAPSTEGGPGDLDLDAADAQAQDGAAGPDAADARPPCDPGQTPAAEACLIDEAFGVFMAPTGSDATGDGSRAHPFKTLGQSASAAMAAGKNVYVCSDQGAYDERPAIVAPSGTNTLAVYGGFLCAGGSWAYSASAHAAFTPSTRGVVLRFDGLPSLDVEDVQATAQGGTAPGESSIAAFVNGVAGAHLARVTLTAGNGANGAGATPAATPATPGNPGEYGNPGGCNCTQTACGTGGTGGVVSCGGILSTGGNGGTSTSTGGAYGGQGNPGLNGSGGTSPGPGSGGIGAGDPLGVAVCYDTVIDEYFGSGNGAGGAAGTAGNAGTGGFGGGVLGAQGWSGVAGTAGAAGSPGGGGGGGGSGTDNIDDKPTCVGDGGGGGGSGGCGGAGGGGGGAGGSSFALVSVASSVTLTDSTLSAGNAGTGGGGAAGQSGAVGGEGGGPFFMCSSTVFDLTDWRPGAGGGTGGAGGQGGSGGGGQGGDSVGLAYIGNPNAPALQSVTITRASAGGAGGADGDGNTATEFASAGRAGVAADTYSSWGDADTTPPVGATVQAVSFTACSAATVAFTQAHDDNTSADKIVYTVCAGTSAGGCTLHASGTLAQLGAYASDAGALESLAISGLQPGTTYFFAVTATDQASNTSAASTTTATTPTALDTLPPVWASTPTATMVVTSPSELSVSWAAAADDCGVAANVTYQVCGSFAATCVSAGTQKSAVVTGLTSNTAYSVYVVATTAGGKASSPTASATTPVSFAGDIEPVLQGTTGTGCAQGGCHAGGANGAPWATGNAYMNLGCTSSGQCGGMVNGQVLVDAPPGDPSNSYLYTLPFGTAYSQMGAVTTLLPDTVSLWIQQGAYDN